MKDLFIFLLIMLTNSVNAENAQLFNGQFLSLKYPYIYYCTHDVADGYENKNVMLHVVNLLTDRKDSINCTSFSSKFNRDEIYYSCENMLKVKKLFQRQNMNDSVILNNQLIVDDFVVDSCQLIYSEVDTTYEHVNIIYCVDGVVLFKKTFPCMIDGEEGHITKIYRYNNSYVISILDDLYVFDKNNMYLSYVGKCYDMLLGNNGDIYMIEQRRDNGGVSAVLYCININDLNHKYKIAETSNVFGFPLVMYSYSIESENCVAVLLGDDLYKLCNHKLELLSSGCIYDDINYCIIINERFNDFLLKYKNEGCKLVD